MKKQPNIILITTDQQRFDTIGELAPKWMRTPHMDYLAKKGLYFKNAYTENPICVPARVSIMLGQNSLNHGMVNNKKSSDVIKEQITLPLALQKLGYQTCAIGKMHFYPERARHGFEEMILPADYYRWMMKSGHPEQPMRHGLGQNEIHPTLATVPESLTLTNWLADQCVEYLLHRKDPNKPYFLWCSFSKPHPPLDPPEPYYSMYKNKDIPKPVKGDWLKNNLPPAFRRFQIKNSHDLINEDITLDARSAYYGLITQVDYNMGRIFGALQDEEKLNETIILFTSDHGDYLGDHNAFNKVFFNEGSAHIPFILKLPDSWGLENQGKILEEPITHADILPTLVACAGGNPKAEKWGDNLLDLTTNLESKWRKYNIGTSTTSNNGVDYFAVTNGKIKYIYYIEGGIEHVFDLVNDPYETKDISKNKDGEKIKTELKSYLISYLKKEHPEYLNMDEIKKSDVVLEDERELRAQSWPGFHTDQFYLDVKH